MKINSVFLAFFLVIIVFPATIFFIYKQSFVGSLTSVGSQTNQLENDPLVQRIKNEVILPFCETGGMITDDNIPDFFSQSFIDFYESKEGDIDVSTLELITPLFIARRTYNDMFIDFQEFTGCDNYIKNIKSKEIEPHMPRLAEDIGYADYIYVYFPVENVRLNMFLVDENNSLKIRAVGVVASPIIIKE
jgi:hypothetical protein